MTVLRLYGAMTPFAAPTCTRTVPGASQHHPPRLLRAKEGGPEVHLADALTHARRAGDVGEIGDISAQGHLTVRSALGIVEEEPGQAPPGGLAEIAGEMALPTGFEPVSQPERAQPRGLYAAV